MADSMDQPNQISYDDVCRYTGKMVLESQYELERLRSMLFELQQKLQDEMSARVKAENSLKESQQKIELLNSQIKQLREGDGNSN